MKIVINNVKVDGTRFACGMEVPVEKSVQQAIIDALSSIDGVSVVNTYDGSPMDEFDVEFVEDGATLTLG